MNFNSAYMRFLVMVLAAVIVIRLVVALLVPVLPWLITVLVVLGIVRVVSWWRGRW